MVLVGCGPSVDIHEAARTGNIEAVKQHLDAGVDVNAKKANGDTPLDFAISNKQAELADLLRKHGGKAKTPNFSIHDAATEGNIAAVKWYLAAGVDVDVKNKYGSTPLHLAVVYAGIAETAIKQGDGGFSRDDVFDLKETVKLLIAKGADVNAKEEDGKTPLYYAVHWRSAPSLVELLIDKGADVNENYGNGKTPLHHAAFRGHNAIVRLLIDKGADVNVQMDDGSTTARSGHPNHNYRPPP